MLEAYVYCQNFDILPFSKLECFHHQSLAYRIVHALRIDRALE